MTMHKCAESKCKVEFEFVRKKGSPQRYCSIDCAKVEDKAFLDAAFAYLASQS